MYDYNLKVVVIVDGGFVVIWYGNYYVYSGIIVIEYMCDIFV